MAEMGVGFRALARDIQVDTGRVGARVSQVVRGTVVRIERDAKILAPVDTGNLRGSINSTITGDGRNARMTAEIGPTASYGIYLEVGTSRMPPQPYMFPSLDRHADNFVNGLAQAVTPKL